MSSETLAIRVRNVSKHFLLFDRPQDRLKQSIVPRLQRFTRRPVTSYYRDFQALVGVSFDVRRGETVGIVGRNGSGKSTLLQILCGTLRPNGGSVEVNGRIAALLELGAGFNPDFTGRENVYLNAVILGMSRSEIELRFDDIARFADIGTFIDQPVKSYSSGMYVRLAFATAINVDPDILVVDEALAVGDEAFQRKCFARIEQIQERGATILFVTHSTQTVVQLCRRAFLFDGGELILDGRPKLVTSQYQRLINASPDIAGEIRLEILNLRTSLSGSHDELGGSAEPDNTTPETDAGHILTEPDTFVQPATAPLLRAQPAPSSGSSSLDTYDPHLRSQSVIRTEERGAQIVDARITTLGGAPVNILEMGKRYLIQYDVAFVEHRASVGFGIGITTITGLLIAGYHCRGNRVDQVPAGSIRNARFEFVCNLLPGTYFITCHVRGKVDEMEDTLHRIADFLVFRVINSDYEVNATGLLDLNMVASLS